MTERINIHGILSILNSAGESIIRHYESQDFITEIKQDDSPVTTADKESDQIISEGLRRIYPDIPVISEESNRPAYEIRQNWKDCWILDPLDGTKEFLGKNGEFSINLALIRRHQPVAGFVHFPVYRRTYYALLEQGAYVQEGEIPRKLEHRQAVGSLRNKEVSILISRSHAGQAEYDFIDRIKGLGYEVSVSKFGAAMKHCMLAEGQGDIYPKFGNCSEWDTAASQIILQEAGGMVTRLDNKMPLRYNKPDFANPAFIMWGPTVPVGLRKILLNS